MSIRVVIGDDDYGMRMLLKKAIEKVDNFDIVGEAEDGAAALALVEKLSPKVVFLDVEMPNMNGVECAKRILDIDPMTIIIFATAHSEYMPEAFQLYAFDYIVKPFKVERVFQTLERIKAIQGEKEVQTKAVNKIIHNSNNLSKMLLKNKEGISFVDLKDIIIIQREERSTVIYTKTDSYTTSEGLSEIEERLDEAQFMRSHKSYIINLAMLDKIYPYGRWTYVVKLKGTDKDALLTHEKYTELKKIFEL